jgi:hypothetical protein
MAKQKTNILGNVLKIILVLVLLAAFFEVGLISSYTIVTSQAPDVKGLIELQIDSITDIFNSNNFNSMLVKDPNTYNLSNSEDVANKLVSMTGVDGVNVNNMTAESYQSSDDSSMDLTIEALGYSSVNVTSTQIVLNENPDFKIIASAKGTSTVNGIQVDLSTIKITSILRLYNTNTTT